MKPKANLDLTVIKGPLTSLFTQSLAMWGAQMGGLAITLLATVFLTRALGPEGRGVYTWLLTLAGLGTHLAMFGLDAFNRRQGALHPEQMPALMRFNIWISTVWGLPVAVMLGIIALTQPAGGGNVVTILAAVLTAPVIAMTIACAALLLVEDRIMANVAITLVPKLVLAVLVGAMVAGDWVSLQSALLINLLAHLVGLGIALWTQQRVLSAVEVMHPAAYLKIMWRTCVGAFGAGFTFFLMQKADVLMVGLMLGRVETGFYGVASSLVDIMMTPVAVITGVLATRLSAGKTEILRAAAGITMGLTAMGCAFTYMIAPWLVPFLFGYEFTPAVPVLQLLCPAVLMLAWFMLMQNVLNARGRARYMPIAASVGVVANVGLNLYFLPRYGLIGACWASIIAYALAAACATVLVRHRVAR